MHPALTGGREDRGKPALAPCQIGLEDAVDRLDILRLGEQPAQFFGIDGRLKLILSHSKTLLLLA